MVCRVPFAVLLLLVVLLVAPAAAGERHECLIEPWELVRLGARNTGVLEDVSVDRGDEVAKGETIASLSSEVERAAVALAQKKAESTTLIELAQARSEFEKLSIDRNATLFDRNVISPRQMDESKATYRIAELRVAEAQLERELAELEYHRALALHDLKTVRTPISGVVVEINRSEGEYLAEGDHVASIAQIDPVRAEAFLPLEMLGRVKEGDVVRVFPQEPVGRELKGVVDVVDRVVEARSGTIGIRVRVENPEKLTLAGLRCELEF
ncbi:MAG TPA: efflux RND transporter periplasmic adaptor subunit [Woeseiaceae bacterium]|nr:efflux RND transporter periplasmic adaptor subunit [Woeseiaceae bacterium]